MIIGTHKKYNIMKIKDIMIGDLVNYNREEITIAPDFFNKIITSNLNVELDSSILGINPIPLTEEVLNRMSFIDEGNGKFIKFEESFSIIINIDNECNALIITNNDSSFCVIMIINFIHELQHALRLCGLNY